MSKVYTLEQFLVGQDIQGGFPGNDDLEGTAGTDIYFGFFGNDTLRGAEGDDFLLGEEGNDSLEGGSGDDFLFISDNNYFDSGFALNNFIGPASLISNAADRQFDITEWYDVFNIPLTASPGVDLTLNGDGGIDTASLDFSFSATALNFTLSSTVSFTLPNGITTLNSIEQIWVSGSTVGDQITGGALDDRLYGFTGNDVLNGGEGKDFLLGSIDSDVLNGNGGNDFLASVNFFQEYARDGAQTVTSYLTGLHTSVESGFFGADDDIAVNGGDGDDTAMISFLANVAGVTFTLSATGASVTLPGLSTQIQNVEAIWAVDSAFADNITGGALDDRFYSNDGAADTFDGRGGVNTVEYGGAVTVNLANDALNNGAAIGDTLIDIQNVIGSEAVDQITGDTANNDLAGRAGDDTLSGAGGDDTLDGGVGADTLLGGAGENTVSYASSVNAVTADLLNSIINAGDAAGDTYTEIQNLIGTRRGDFLSGDNGANEIDGGLGSDSLVGRGGSDTFQATAGADTVNGGTENDTLVLEGEYLDYSITAVSGGFLITDVEGGLGRDGTERVTSVENFIFADDVRSNLDLLNVAPDSIALVGDSVDENAAGGTIVGQFSAVDRDGDPVTFSITSETDLFVIDGAGRLRVANGANINFEGSPTQTITVEADDGQGGTRSQTFVIDINDLNEAPTNITLSATTIAENAAGGTVVGDLAAIDPDGAGGLAFTLIDGGDLFEIVGDELRVKAGAVLDFEDDADLDITIRVSDGVNTFDKDFTITLTDVPEPIDGDGGKNTLQGTNGVDTINGFGGNDVLVGKGGADELNGGSGVDTARYDQTVRLNLENTANSTGHAKGDVFDSVEKFLLSDGDDTLLGSAGKDDVRGGDGADDLQGKDGGDKLSGEGGADVIDGGAGKDTLLGGSNDDEVLGGDGDDRASGDDGDDLVDGGIGNDTVDGGGGDDKVVGGEGNDTITGGDGADLLGARQGNDRLDGGTGNDTLLGATGNDTMTGGKGADEFSFDPKFGTDTITDFKGRDVILFNSRLFQDDGDVFDAMTERNGDVIIRFSADDKVILKGLEISDLNNGDFDFF